MKGIILSGGFGTRLFPLTIPYSKQLLPIFDKPMIYYPLSTLMSMGIRDILIITTPSDLKLFKKLFLNSINWGIKIKFTVQKKPKGIAESFILAKDFIKNDKVSLILGDNIFNGINFNKISDIIAKETEHRNTGAVVNQPYKDIIKRLGAFLNMED